jgi:hypothetical protein
MNELKLEDLAKWDHHLSIKRLRKIIEDLPDDGKVLVQRVEDRYYEGNDISGMTGTLPDGSIGTLPEGSKANGWPVVLKEGEAYYNAKRLNENMQEEIYRRADGYPPEYPGIENPEDYIYTDEQLEKLKDQYTPAWCYVRYSDDDKNLYIDLHY